MTTLPSIFTCISYLPCGKISIHTLPVTFFENSIFGKAHSEAKQNIATHSELSVEITGRERHLEDVIDTFRKLHQLSIKGLFEKVNLTQLPATGSHAQNFDMSIMSY